MTSSSDSEDLEAVAVGYTNSSQRSQVVKGKTVTKNKEKIPLDGVSDPV